MQTGGRSISIPLNSPLYPPPPYACQDSKTLYFIYEAELESVKKVLPEPLSPFPQGLVSVMLRELHFPDSFGTYNETIVNVLASYEGLWGWYIAYIYCNSDMALASGREIWGAPKKWGQTRFIHQGSSVTASLEIGGLEVLSAAAELVAPARPTEMLPQLEDKSITNYCLKVIPGISDGRPEIKQLISVERQSFALKECERCRGKISFSEAPGLDPLHELAPKGEWRVFFSVFDYVLGFGKVVYDYLRPGA